MRAIHTKNSNIQWILLSPCKFVRTTFTARRSCRFLEDIDFRGRKGKNGTRRAENFRRKVDQSADPWTYTPIRFLRSYVTEPSSAVTRGSLFFLRVQMSVGLKVTSIDRHSPRCAAIVSLLIRVLDTMGNSVHWSASRASFPRNFHRRKFDYEILLPRVLSRWHRKQSFSNSQNCEKNEEALSRLIEGAWNPSPVICSNNSSSLHAQSLIATVATLSTRDRQ